MQIGISREPSGDSPFSAFSAECKKPETELISVLRSCNHAARVEAPIEAIVPMENAIRNHSTV